MPTNLYTAQRLFERQSKDAYKRNSKCVCEREVTVLIKTKGRGERRLDLGGATPKHFSTCQHSELERTTRPRTARVKRRSISVEMGE